MKPQAVDEFYRRLAKVRPEPETELNYKTILTITAYYACMATLA